MAKALGLDGLRREPYRVLFPLGAAAGCLGVGHWLAYALGWAPSSRAIHAAVQIGAYMACFILGFLMTAAPRMTSTPPATRAELLAIVGLVVGQIVLAELGWPLAAQVLYAALLAMLLAFAGRRMLGRGRAGGGGPPAGAPTEMVWVPIGVLFGLTGSALAGLTAMGWLPPQWMDAARPMAQQGFVLSVVLGVGGFMAPRLLGRGVTPVGLATITTEAMRRRRRQRLLLHGAAALGLALSFALEGLGRTGPAYLLRASVATALLMWTATLWRPPAVPDQYAWQLWASLWAVVAGLWAAGVWPHWRLAGLHVMLLGGFSLMTFAVGTMVMLSHAGQADRLRRPLPVLRAVGVGLPLATILRATADLWPAHYFVLLGAAAVAWLVPAVWWLAFSLRYVARPAPEGAMERLHDQARRRLQPDASAPSSC
jgi:uncharacterized protein involved in response to NO